MLSRLIILILITTVFGANSAIAQTALFIPFEYCPDEGPIGIEYHVSQAGPVELEIEDVFTNLHVTTLTSGIHQPGQHSVFWDGTDDLDQPVGTGIYIFKLRGDGWEIEEWCAVECGVDAAIQSRVIVGGRDVSMGFANIVEEIGDTELAIYSSDGTTRIRDFSDIAHSRITFFFWALEDSLDQVVPAGDYIYRMTSPSYSEDIPFALDPFERGELTVTITDGLGNQATGIPGIGDAPVVKGPLQYLEVDFGRPMSEAEIEYLLDGGLAYGGAFEWARPSSPTVRPDSTGLIFHDFDLSRSWPDIWGSGTVRGYGLFDPYSSRFQFGFDHQGITSRDDYCQPRGEEDANDWVINPGPFFFTPTGTLEPPCNNPIPLGQWAEIRYAIDTDGPVLMSIIDSEGNLIRPLVREYQQAGPKTVFWDRLDDSGNEVPEGFYHLIWSTDHGDCGAVITSGDILVSNAVSLVPQAVSDPMLPTLTGNHPNPFNPATVISFLLPTDSFAEITVLSLDGKRVTTLLADHLAAGHHSVTWNGRNHQGRTVPSGAYFARLESGGLTSVKAMVLVR